MKTATLKHSKSGNTATITITVDGREVAAITRRTVAERNSKATEGPVWLRNLPLEITGDAAVADAVMVAVTAGFSDTAIHDEYAVWAALCESSQGFEYKPNWAKRDPRTRAIEAANKARRNAVVEF